MKNFVIALLGLGASFVLPAFGSELPVHCPNDTAKASRILQTLRAEKGRRAGELMAMAALSLEGAGADTYYRTDSVGTLRINLESFTPLTFVENVIALTKAANYPGVSDWRTFGREFENIACRRGENTGFPSVMFHGADWISDNIARGNIVELTENYEGAVANTKSLDEMTRKRADFAALSDSTTFETVRMTEMGFRTHRIPMLKKETIKKKEIREDLRDGDIILLVSNPDGHDIYDMGIVTIEDGAPYFVHVSPYSHTVVKEKDELGRYMNLVTKYFKGYRLLRIKE